MYRNARAMRRDFEDGQFQVTRTVVDYGRLAPAILAARERLETELARQALLRDAGPSANADAGRFRQWCGALAIRLGSWLGGERSSLGPALPVPPQHPAAPAITPGSGQ